MFSGVPQIMEPQTDPRSGLETWWRNVADSTQVETQTMLIISKRKYNSDFMQMCFWFHVMPTDLFKGYVYYTYALHSNKVELQNA